MVESYLNYKEALAIKKGAEVYQKIAEIYKMQNQHKKAYDSYQTALTFLYTPQSKISDKRICLIESGKMALLLQDFEGAIHPLKDAL